MSLVQRPTGVQERLYVAIRVDASGPVADRGLEVPLNQGIQQGARLHSPNPHVKPDLGCHRLDDLCQLDRVGLFATGSSSVGAVVTPASWSSAFAWAISRAGGANARVS